MDQLVSWMQQALGGSMVLAVPVALVVGLISFFSPCVVPLLPGYLSFASGLGASEVLEGKGSRGRMLAGTVLFVLGFAFVFVTTGVLFGTVGAFLSEHRRLITPLLGVLAVVLGLVFLGVIPLGRRTLRIHRVPRLGIAAAPLLGLAFGFGWTPCIGPTLAVVLTLAMNEGSAVRGGILAFVYALGLGIPFVVAGLAYTRMSRTVEFLRHRQLAVQRLGGVAMVATGLLMVTGLWDLLMAMIRQWANTFGAVV